MTAQSHPAPVRVLFDLSRAFLVGRFLRWRHARTALQFPVLAVALLVVYDGLFGPQLAPKNLAGVLPWIHWRAAIVLALLLVGNLFCLSCPFMLVRGIAKRLFPASRPWPKLLQSRWLAALLLIAFFWSYEALDLWASPALTAALALIYFGSAFAVDAAFKGAAFCKYLCPIGSFHFANSVCSPMEVTTRDRARCTTCRTKDCIKGGPLGKGCELWLFQEKKVGNLDCTFCLDCLHACPHENVGIIARVPASELWRSRVRSSVGQLEERPDLTALALVVVFGAFMNAFGMVSPAYDAEKWLSEALGTNYEPAILLVLFAVGFVALPVVAVAAASWAGRTLARRDWPLLRLASRYSFSLLPVGFGMWLAHYSFHFLTGALTIVPVAQSFVSDLGAPLLGVPRWGMGPLVPASWLFPIELLFLEIGLLGSLIAAYRMARADMGEEGATMGLFLSWAAIAVALFGLGIWLMLQPMEMRGTFG